MKPNGQNGSASFSGISGKATANTNISSNTLATAANSQASRWRSPGERENSNTRPQARGWLEPIGSRAPWMRFLSLRLKPKAAAAPNSGRGPGAEAAAAGAGA